MYEGRKPLKVINRPLHTGIEVWFYFPCVFGGGAGGVKREGNLVIVT